MVRRPLRNKRPIGPILDYSDSRSSDETQTGDPTFDSLDDLPDSPMLRQYVERQAEYLNKDIEEVINSKPVKDYMKRLGVWEQAIRENR